MSHQPQTVVRVAEKAAAESSQEARVQLLGACSLSLDGEDVDLDRWPKKARTLLRLLAVRHGHRIARDDAIETLWPDAPPEAGVNSLKSLLHRVRGTHAEGAELSPLVLSHGWVMLNGAWTWSVDAAELLDAADSAGADIARLERVVDLLRGEPLPEDRYEEWAIPVRDRFMRTWRELALRLSSLYGMHGLHEQRLDCLERVVAFDPLDEEAVGELMRAMHALGRGLDATRRYEAFAEALEREMGLEPSVELVQLASAIRSHHQAGADARVADSPVTPGIGKYLGARPDTALIGRQAERERMTAAIQTMEKGAGRFLMVSGEAGIGRTRIAQEASVLAWERGDLVAALSCTQSTSDLPFSLVYDVLALASHAVDPSIRLDVLREWPLLSSLLDKAADPTLGTPGGEYESRLHRTAAGALSSIARRRPLAMLVDDLQWADDGSLRFLDYLVRHTRDSSLLVVATCTYDSLPSEHAVRLLLRRLAHAGLVEQVDLRRLSRDETEALIATIMPQDDVSPELLGFVYARTKGNPFFVHRLLEKLHGHYRLLRRVGVGGTAQVFEAVDLDTEQSVAVKIMFARTEADASARLRFQREVIALSRLAHPNVVRILDSFVDEHSGFLITELATGKPLQELIRVAPLPLDRIRAIALQVIAALESAHGRGIVHGDIKPSNILVGLDDRVIVTDFGVATLVRPQSDASLTTTGMRMATPLYMAPEQIDGKAVDPRADLYSLGAVLYEMATGRPPFRGPDALSVAMQHHHEAPRAPSALRRLLPPEWDAVILQLLSKDRVERPQSAAALRPAVAALPCPRAPVDGAAHAVREGRDAVAPSAESVRARRSPRSTMAVAGAALAAVTLGGTLLIQRLNEQATYADGTPQQAVAAYVRLLQAGKVDDAFTLTTTADSPDPRSARLRFHIAFDQWHQQAHGVSILSAHISRTLAQVAVEIGTYDGNVLGESESTSRRTFSLRYSHGRWRIEDPVLGLP